MDYSTIVTKQRTYFHSQQTKPLAARKAQLKLFKQMLVANETRIYEAVYADFHKSAHEAFLTEFAILIKDIDEALAKLSDWMQAKRVPTNLVNLPGRSRIQPEPLGVCLVIGAWNYPYQLSPKEPD
jgi:aldehyde dehydrogenase (NAD+)